MKTNDSDIPMQQLTEVIPRVAILMSSREDMQQLSALLSDTGLDIILEDTPNQGFLTHLKQTDANILLVDIPGSTELEMEIIDTLLEDDLLPVLYHDSGTNGCINDRLWIKNLYRKLTGLVQQYPVTATTDLTLSNKEYSVTYSSEQNSHSIDSESGQSQQVSSDFPAKNVWVLGASLGGPQAIRQFLSVISPELPVAFLLAQHIGVAHMAAMAEQLNSITSFSVYPATEGHPLRHHDVVLIPADKQIIIAKDGYLKLRPSTPGALFAPDIDNVLNTVVAHYGDKAGVIFFSGMGTDGVKASKSVAQLGGQVWAQDADSCVVSSLPDHVRKTGCVSFSGAPVSLARHLNQYYNL